MTDRPQDRTVQIDLSLAPRWSQALFGIRLCRIINKMRHDKEAWKKIEQRAAEIRNKAT